MPGQRKKMISKKHPRYESLRQREALVRGYRSGITSIAGLIAHGRGEAFDYLMGEKTLPQAEKAISASAALLLLARNPVISVNGNTAALCSKGLVRLAKAANAKLEINLFYRSQKRVMNIKKLLLKNGADKVYGVAPKKVIEGIASSRGKVDEEGIYSSDVVLVALEDGDRTEALVRAGKRVIAIDLNPLSRTAQAASITIVDNVTRAAPALVERIRSFRGADEKKLEKELRKFSNSKNLSGALDFINKRLKKSEF